MISTAWFRPTLPANGAPGAGFANDFEFARRIGRAEGEAIAHRARGGRSVAIRGDIYCKHAAAGAKQLDCFD